MKVVLRKTVAKLGSAGEVKEVATGYGLNFLLPQGLAEVATESAVKNASRMAAREQKRKTEEQAEAERVVKKLEGVRVTIRAKAKEGKLFGSVDTAMVAAALKEEGFAVVDGMLKLEKPFKQVGEHTVTASQGAVTASLTVVIVAA
jgi:large subunit ribosomal protein L9